MELRSIFDPVSKNGAPLRDITLWVVLVITEP